MEGDSGIRRYCLECGSEVEPGADFCYACGSRRVVEVRPDSNRVVMEPGHCPFCGHDNDPQAKFCTSCGRRIGEFEYVPRLVKRLSSMDFAILMAALVPGLFNVFGLGHLLAKKYSRAAVYLVISAVFLYIRYSVDLSEVSTIIILELIGIVIYLKQSMEIFSIVFTR